MTWQEFLSSEDPSAMLAALTGGDGDHLRPYLDDVMPLRPLISGRQLRSFSVAVALMAGEVERYVEDVANENQRRENGMLFWARCWCQSKPGTASARVAQGRKADILRDIVGNPSSPLTIIRLDTGMFAQLEWLHRLAVAAYEERLARKCGECDDGIICHERDMSSDRKCNACSGTGRIVAVTLDPARLAILSDALEEAGANAPCVFCGGKGHHETGMVRCDMEGIHDTREKITCVACCGSGHGSHPVTTHLRSPGIIHVRGCWALDLVLGKE